MEAAQAVNGFDTHQVAGLSVSALELVRLSLEVVRIILRIIWRFHRNPPHYMKDAKQKKLCQLILRLAPGLIIGR
jgi:cytochrome b561